jgi:hypothetical protein
VPPTGKGGRAASHKADSIWLTNGQVFCGWLTAQSLRRNFDSSHRFASRQIVSLACRPA